MFVDIFNTGKKYDVIYADPPWQYNNKKSNGAAENHYKVMTLDEIKNLPIKNIANENCILFIWGTYPMLKECIQTIEQWGFNYKTIAFNWIKLNKKAREQKINNIDDFKKVCFFGLGNYTRANTEFCLIGLKGKFTKHSNSISQLVFSPLEQHSKKPDEVREKIQQLTGSQTTKIELFARQQVNGWDSWGNEIPGFNEEVKKKNIIDVITENIK